MKVPPLKKSNINLDTGLYSGDIGLGDEYYVKSLFSDIMLVKYIDINESGLREIDGLRVPTLTNDVVWRKGEVVMVGPDAKVISPGDLVIFPNDKGLPTSTVFYLTKDGNIEESGNAIFLDEARVFAKISKKQDD